MTLLLTNAPARLKAYDSHPKAIARYNPAAAKAYRHLATGSLPRSSTAWSALQEALAHFDMHRQLGALGSPNGETHFAALRRTLKEQSHALRQLLRIQLTPLSINNPHTLRSRRTAIARVFDELSGKGRVVPGKRFPVGASKTLHFLNPRLFPIIDSRIAAELHGFEKALPRLATPYTGEDYVLALEVIAEQIKAYGAARLQRLQPTQPILRIVDKILFV